MIHEDKSRMTRLTVPMLAAAVAMSLSLAQSPAYAEGETIDSTTITLTDGVVSPQLVEVKAGQATKLVVVNAGTKPAEFESKRLRIEQIVAPGAKMELTLRALPAGEYPFVEEFHENLDSGRGKIVAK